MTLILTAIYFILPSYIANMCPVIAGKLKFPFGNSIHAKLFGKNKTWRGFYAAYIGSFLILFLQQYLTKYAFFSDISLLDYSKINIFLFAFLFGIGALTGDLIKSFFKRRLGKKPGAPWFPFDQIDFIIFSIIFLAPFYFPSWQIILTLFIITPLLHFLTNLTAYFLGMKKVWW